MVKILFLLLFVFAVDSFAQTSNSAALGTQTISLIEPLKQILFDLGKSLLPLGVVFFVFVLLKKFFLDKWVEELENKKMAKKGYVRKDPYQITHKGKHYVNVAQEQERKASIEAKAQARKDYYEAKKQERKEFYEAKKQERDFYAFQHKNRFFRSLK